MQTSALLLPGIGLALPAAHAMHDALLDAPVSGLYVPAGHGSNVCRTLAAPSEAQKPPLGHWSHVVARRSSLSVPVGHVMQLSADSPSSGLYVPGVQGRQLGSPKPTTGGGKR